MTEVTEILRSISAGDRQESGRLLPLVYEALRKLAAAKMAHEPAGQTLQPTALEKELLRDVYLEHVRPFLSENRSRRSVLKSPLASAVEAQRLFHQHETTLPATLHPVLAELKEFCEVRRQIELQRQILRWMHGWLMIHVPAAAALLIFLVAHVVMALRIIPFTN